MRPYVSSIYIGLAALAASWSLAVSASTFIVTEEELDPEIFPQVADSIRANLDGPNAPKGLTRARKQDALNTLERIESLLEDDPDGNRSKILAQQVRLNAALAPTVARENNQSEVVCRRVKKVGSNIPTTECKTRAEIEAEKHYANEEIRRMQMGRSMDD